LIICKSHQTFAANAVGYEAEPWDQILREWDRDYLEGRRYTPAGRPRPLVKTPQNE
jgi:hypothetical protein